MNQDKKCAYPNCSECVSSYSIPLCMLDEAGIDTSKDILIEPHDGYVTIKQDEGGNE